MPVEEKSPPAPSPLSSLSPQAANGYGAASATVTHKNNMEQNGLEQNGSTPHPYTEAPPRKLLPCWLFILASGKVLSSCYTEGPEWYKNLVDAQAHSVHYK